MRSSVARASEKESPSFSYGENVKAENNSTELIEIRNLSNKQLLNFNGCIRGEILNRCKFMFPAKKTPKEWENEIAPLFVKELEEEEAPLDASFDIM